MAMPSLNQLHMMPDPRTKDPSAGDTAEGTTGHTHSSTPDRPVDFGDTIVIPAKADSSGTGHARSQIFIHLPYMYI